jgi:hypothetical protein
MRGTIHLVSRDDYLAFRPAVQPALTAGMLAILKDRLRGIEIDPLVKAARAVFAKFPGEWQVREMTANSGATAFWRTAIPVPFTEDGWTT